MGSKCVCDFGYYDDGTSTSTIPNCLACDSTCKKSCKTTNTNCGEKICLSGYTFDYETSALDWDCVKCYDKYSYFCEACDISGCTSCGAGK